MANERERMLWPDIAKCVGLFLMVLGHGGLSGRECVEQFIYSFHMPMFFVISGVFFYPSHLKKSFKGIIIPYLTMNILMLLWSLFFAIIHHENIWNFCLIHIPAIIIGLGYNTHSLIPVCSPMWFFYTLFIVQLFANMCNFNHDKLKSTMIFFSFISVVIVFLLKYYQIDLLLPIDSALFAFPFFTGGLVLKEILCMKQQTLNMSFVVIVSLVVLFITNSLNGRIDINTMNIGNNLLLTYLGGFSGSFIVIYLSKIISSFKFFSYKRMKCLFKLYSMGSSVIVGLNLLLITIISKMYLLMYPKFHYSILTGITTALLIMLLCFPVIIFFLRLCPSLIGRNNK